VHKQSETRDVGSLLHEPAAGSQAGGKHSDLGLDRHKAPKTL